MINTENNGHNMNANDHKTAVHSAANLRELCDALNEACGYVTYEVSDLGNNLTSLQTFGGAEPADTDEIWSWNDTHVITTDGRGDFIIIPR